MNEKLILFIGGGIAGFFIAMMITILPFSYASKYRAVIAECEKSLPRDKNCKVIGVVNEPPN